MFGFALGVIVGHGLGAFDGARFCQSLPRRGIVRLLRFIHSGFLFAPAAVDEDDPLSLGGTRLRTSPYSCFQARTVPDRRGWPGTSANLLTRGELHAKLGDEP